VVEAGELGLQSGTRKPRKTSSITPRAPRPP
jgi:hypothetical protein